jgi:hypothetical protein
MGGSWHDRCLTVWAPNDCGDSALARSPSSRSPKKPPIASPRMSPGRSAQPCGTPGVTRSISPTTTTSTSGHSIAGDSPKCWANPTTTTTSSRYDRRGVDLTNTQPTLDPPPRFRSGHPQATTTWMLPAPRLAQCVPHLGMAAQQQYDDGFNVVARRSGPFDSGHCRPPTTPNLRTTCQT